jgi:hypothetical protein
LIRNTIDQKKIVINTIDQKNILINTIDQRAFLINIFDQKVREFDQKVQILIKRPVDQKKFLIGFTPVLDLLLYGNEGLTMDCLCFPMDFQLFPMGVRASQ